MKRFDIRLLPIVIVVFLGFLGFSLPFPLFSPMILDEGFGFLPASFLHHHRKILLGFLLGVYPLGQLFGCPFFGQLSDQYGRRKVLLISLILTFSSYVLSALAVKYTHFILLVISRFFCGIFEGNVVIANSAVADISDENTKGRNYGFVAFATSMGFIIGPLGAKFADSSVVSWFNLALPFWLVCVLVVITYLTVYLFFEETFVCKKKEKLRLFQGFSSIYKGLLMPKLRLIYLVNFFIYFGMFSYFNYFPVLLIDQYHFSISELPVIIAFVSVPVGLSALTVVGPLSKRLSARKATAIGGLLYSFILFCMTFNQPLLLLYLNIFFVGIFIGICLTNMVVLVSNRTDIETQGMALGINQSVQVLAEASTAVFGGMLVACFACLPMIVGSGVSFLAALILFAPYLKRNWKETI